MEKNLTTLVGTILDEPTLRTTKSGVNVSNFFLKVDSDVPKNEFTICITAWGANAIHCKTLYSRGNRIKVNGKLGISANTQKMELQLENVTSV